LQLDYQEASCNYGSLNCEGDGWFTWVLIAKYQFSSIDLAMQSQKSSPASCIISPFAPNHLPQTTPLYGWCMLSIPFLNHLAYLPIKLKNKLIYQSGGFSFKNY